MRVAKVEFPLWMARPLAGKGMVELDLPKHYTDRCRKRASERGGGEGEYSCGACLMSHLTVDPRIPFGTERGGGGRGVLLTCEIRFAQTYRFPPPLKPSRRRQGTHGNFSLVLSPDNNCSLRGGPQCIASRNKINEAEDQPSAKETTRYSASALTKMNN